MKSEMQERIELRAREIRGRRQAAAGLEVVKTTQMRIDRLKSIGGLPIREAVEIGPERRYLLAGLVASYTAINATTELYPISLKQRRFRKAWVPDQTVLGWQIDGFEESMTHTGRDDVGKPITKHVNSLIVRPDYCLNLHANTPARLENQFFAFDEDRVIDTFALNGIEWVEPDPSTYQ